MMRKILLFSLILLQIFGLLYGAWHDTATYDEPANISASFDYVARGDFRIYPDNPPLVKMLSGLFLLPFKKEINFSSALQIYGNPEKFDLYAFGREFLFRSGNNAPMITFVSRLPNIIFTISIGILIYLSAKDLFGRNAAFLSLFFYTLDPNVRGHGHILAFDLPLTFFILSVFYFTVRLVRGKNKYRPVYISLIIFAFFLMFLTKFTAVFFFFIYSGGLMVYAFIISGSKKSQDNDTLPGPGSVFFLLVSIPVVSFLLIWVFAYFTGLNKPVLDYAKLPMISSADQKLSKDIKWNIIKSAPLPYYYKTGMQVMYAHNIISQPAFLLGEVRAKNDWFWYFPVSFLLKTPLPVLVLIFLTIVLLLRNLFRKNSSHRSKVLFQLFPFIAAFSFMLFMMLFSHINNVYRYLFPSLALFFLGTGQIANLIPKKSVKSNIFFFAIISYLLLTSLFSFPYDLSYTNELTGIPPKPYKYLSDSEVDWGQDLGRLADWLSHNPPPATRHPSPITLSYLGTADPEYFGIKYKPLRFEDLDNLKGIVAISVGNLTLGDWQFTSTQDYKLGLTKAPLDFLRAKKPYAVIGKSIFVYKL